MSLSFGYVARLVLVCCVSSLCEQGRATLTAPVIPSFVNECKRLKEDNFARQKTQVII